MEYNAAENDEDIRVGVNNAFRVGFGFDQCSPYVFDFEKDIPVNISGIVYPKFAISILSVGTGLLVLFHLIDPFNFNNHKVPNHLVTFILCRIDANTNDIISLHEFASKVPNANTSCTKRNLTSLCCTLVSILWAISIFCLTFVFSQFLIKGKIFKISSYYDDYDSYDYK